MWLRASATAEYGLGVSSIASPEARLKSDAQAPPYWVQVLVYCSSQARSIEIIVPGGIIIAYKYKALFFFYPENIHK